MHHELKATTFLHLFQAWVLDNVTNDFQDGFIVDVEPNEKEGYVYYKDFVAVVVISMVIIIM